MTDTYLGCREFAAGFGYPQAEDRPLPETSDLGLMLFDLDYEHDDQGRGIRGKPRFFAARLDKGVIQVPLKLYERR